MFNIILASIASIIIGWVGHVLWFSIYRNRYMVSSTKSFTIVSNKHINIVWDEVFDLQDTPVREEEDNNETDFILLGDD